MAHRNFSVTCPMQMNRRSVASFTSTKARMWSMCARRLILTNFSGATLVCTLKLGGATRRVAWKPTWRAVLGALRSSLRRCPPTSSSCQRQCWALCPSLCQSRWCRLRRGMLRAASRSPQMPPQMLVQTPPQTPPRHRRRLASSLQSAQPPPKPTVCVITRLPPLPPHRAMCFTMPLTGRRAGMRLPPPMDRGHRSWPSSWRRAWAQGIICLQY
mmetsp:Transcript_47150/g.118767  ORF Transcript_47150/g.118767 Transcript_47150/m.118767 type:complete len:214 (-) Transcript_47150:87-728(-)